MLTLDQLLQFAGVTLTAGSLSIAIMIFTIPDSAKKIFLPFILSIGATSAISLLLSSFFILFLTFDSFIDQIYNIVIFFVEFGVVILIIAPIYIFYKLIRINISVNYSEELK